jgi:DNA-3-methyladenine glycosylase II
MDDFPKALAHFKRADPILHKAALKVRTSLENQPRRRRRGNASLFAALASSVVSQQLATKAADSIWERLRVMLGGKVTPEAVRKAPMAKLRKAGLSGAKAKTLKALAKEVEDGLSLASLSKRTKEEATERLTQVWGIGPWTCEMFLMFALEHPDIFSARDLGLVRSMETLYGLPRGVELSKLEKMAEAWAPYRSYACRVLWRHRDSNVP